MVYNCITNIFTTNILVIQFYNIDKNISLYRLDIICQ